MFKVDIFVLKDDLYARQEFSRRRPEIIPETDHMMQVASPEDMILTKLVWYQDGGCVSERQWLDAKGVILVQGERLDHEYLSEWAGNLGIKELLEKLKRDVSGK